MFYKAVNTDNKIVDVYIDTELPDKYVKQVRINNNETITMLCPASEAFGILASDNSVIFSIGETQTDDYPLVTLRPFEGRGEYDYLKQQIQEQREIDYEEEESDQDDSELPDRVPSRAELMEQINMLTECILEMSEIIYG